LVAGRQSETKGRLRGKCKTTAKVAAACETKRQPASELRLGRNPRAFRPERMSISPSAHN
ncbi:MAG: hypothetical protein O4808_21875, partial [Trichodesmium sp. St17_bin3_1_1]|nr:hypothetical protein [Trichodesmium sp. St17_bin3_1_1]